MAYGRVNCKEEQEWGLWHCAKSPTCQLRGNTHLDCGMFLGYDAVSTDLTVSQSLTEAVYDLAARPEYIRPLRDEAEQVIAAEGWTKNGMSKLWKLDSFLKESLRFQGNISAY